MLQKNTINRAAILKVAVTIIISFAMVATGLAVPAAVYADTNPSTETEKVDFSGEGETTTWEAKATSVSYDSASVNENLTVSAVGKVGGKVVVEQGKKMKPAKKKGTLTVALKKKYSGYLSWSKIKKDPNFKKKLKSFKKKYHRSPKIYRIRMKKGQKFWNSGTANGFRWLSDYVGSKWTSSSKAWIRSSNGGKTWKKESCNNTVRLSGSAPKSYYKYGTYTLVLRGTAKAGLSYNVTIVKTVEANASCIVEASCKHENGEVHSSARAAAYASATAKAYLTIKVYAASSSQAKASAIGQLSSSQKAKLDADARADVNVSVMEKLNSEANATAEAKVYCNIKPKVTPTLVDLYLNKILTGKQLQSGEFNFELTGSNGTSKTATNDASGIIAFNGISLAAAGTYTFTVKEINTGKPGYTYDSSVKTATVVVVADGETALKVQSITWSGSDNTFRNSYNSPDRPPVISIIGGAAHVYENGAVYVYIEASDPDGDEVNLRMSDLLLSGVSGHFAGLVERNVRYDGTPLPAGVKAWRVTLWSDGGIGNVTVSATVRSIGVSQIEQTATDSLTIPVRKDDF